MIDPIWKDWNPGDPLHVVGWEAPDGEPRWSLSPSPHHAGWLPALGELAGEGLPEAAARALLAAYENDREAQGLTAPPRSWFYTSERLPRPGQAVRFWRLARGGAIECARCEYECEDGLPLFLGWTTIELAPELRVKGGVYAWEAEPAAPPLPDAPREAQDA